MKCETAEELISALIDDELTPAERTRVEEHARACPACAGAQTWLQETRAAVRTIARYQHELPPGFWPALLKRLNVPESLPRAPQAARSRLWPVRVPVRAALSVGIAAAVVGLALGIAWFAPMPADRAAAELPIAVLALDFERQVAVAAPRRAGSDAFPQAEGLVAYRVKYGPELMRPADPRVTFVGHSTRYVNGVMAVKLTYASGPHGIALYQLPAEQARMPAGPGVESYAGRFRIAHTEGCSIVAWPDGDTVFAVVSDLPSERLLGVAQSLAAAAAAPGA